MARREVRIIAIALAAGAVWGLMNALVNRRFEGSEIVLLEAFLFVPAWFLGRAVGRPGAGAIAGLAYVGAAIAVYELLPLWGLEANVGDARGTGLSPELFVDGYDAEDIMLISTAIVGALIAAGGSIGRRAEVAPGADPPGPEAVLPTVAGPVYAPYSRPVVAAATLVAALATDAVLAVVFGIWTDPQNVVAGGFAFVALVAGILAARRHAIAAIVVGVLFAAAFAGVQEWEYQQRAGDDADPVDVVWLR